MYVHHLITCTCSLTPLTQPVPKDPFLHPHAFSLALSSYISSLVPSYLTSDTHHLPTDSSITTTPFANAQIPGLPHTSQHHLTTVPTPLTRELVDLVDSCYAKRVATVTQADNTSALGSTPIGVNISQSSAPPGTSSGIPKRGRVKRALKGKLEDLTNAVSSTITDTYDDGGEGADVIRDDSGVTGATATTLSNTEADENLSVGSSGGQIFRGMGNLLLSGASGITGVGSTSNSTANIWDVDVDLKRFVTSILHRSHHRKRARRKGGSAKSGDSVDFGRSSISVGGGSSGGMGGRLNSQFVGMPVVLHSIANRDHDALVTMLWSGRVADIVALREWEKERERIESMGLSGSPNPVSLHGTLSDGDEARSDGRTTEGEDSDLQTEGRPGGSFGGVWSEKMQRKLESWTG